MNVAKFLRTAFVIATPVAAFDQTLIYTLKINELIVFSSCTMSSACVSIIKELELQINSYEIENDFKNVP